MLDVAMTYAGIETAVSQMNAAKGTLDQVIKDLDNAVKTLKESWTGLSYEAFKTAWEEAKPKMNTLSQKIEQYGPELNQVLERQKATDQDIARHIQNNVGY